MLGSIRKCWLLLTPRQRWWWAVLIPLAVVSAAMEALGAAAVFALIKVITDPGVVSTWPLLSRWAPPPAGDTKSIVVMATVTVAAFQVVKNIVLAAVAALEGRVITDSVTAFSTRMLKGYLSLPFEFHFRRNSSELICNITDSADQALRVVLSSIIAATSEAFIVAGIVVVLLITAPMVALIAVGVLFALLLLALRLTRRAMTEWGAQEHDLKRLTLETLRQTLGGLKEVKLRGRERFFYDRFARQQGGLMRLRHLSGALSVASRLLIETVFVCGTLLVVVLVTLRGVGTGVVALLGLYAYAGFRIIPSVNRILMHLGNIRYGTPAIEGLYGDLLIFRDSPVEVLESGDAGTVRFVDRLVVERVSYTYEGAHAPALQEIDLTIRRGESVGIVGPTGAGKSTLIDLLLGLLRPSTGRITVDGVDMLTRLKAWQRKIGYVPQAVYLIDDTLRRNIAFGQLDEEIDERRLEAAVQMAQLHDVVAALPLGLATVVGERGIRLSGGERQRVAIARALYHEPELLVFDEATSALDNQTERELTRAIEALHGQKTMLIIAHRLSTVRRCDRLVFLRDGRLAGLGSYDDLVEHNDDFRAMASYADPDRGSA